ncbi:hypothetical protein CAMGR0001_2207 [Campylobacter gracilis RM3268]|uniref:Uncharacterized protein n=1 Tax=Campylobacter gracilis RM3268 TaxID=553220 RepID=C8PH19_9BACT|nr:hypothetical protein CAMGR0001_2207 [Campylobacter gracilis RM3268]
MVLCSQNLIAPQKVSLRVKFSGAAKGARLIKRCRIKFSRTAKATPLRKI